MKIARRVLLLPFAAAFFCTLALAGNSIPHASAQSAFGKRINETALRRDIANFLTGTGNGGHWEAAGAPQNAPRFLTFYADGSFREGREIVIDRAAAARTGTTGKWTIRSAPDVQLTFSNGTRATLTLDPESDSFRRSDNRRTYQRVRRLVTQVPEESEEPAAGTAGKPTGSSRSAGNRSTAITGSNRAAAAGSRPATGTTAAGKPAATSAATVRRPHLLAGTKWRLRNGTATIEFLADGTILQKTSAGTSRSRWLPDGSQSVRNEKSTLRFTITANPAYLTQTHGNKTYVWERISR
jgi:hypothetical protein